MTDSQDSRGDKADFVYIPDPEPATGDNFSGDDGVLSVPVPAAKYAAGKYATAQDSDLVAGNILDGVTIFGVEGTIVSPEPATGDNFTGDDGDPTIPVPAAKYAAGKIATAQDSDLVAGNIKSGITIFGVEGNYAGEGTISLKSIQYGSITIPADATSATATITDVNTANCILFPLGLTVQEIDMQYSCTRIVLTNATTVTAIRGYKYTGITPIVNFVVVEFDTGIKSMQQSTITLNAPATSATATITAVNTAKCILSLLGFTNTSGALISYDHIIQLSLTNSTTVTATLLVPAGNYTIGFIVLEFL